MALQAKNQVSDPTLLLEKIKNLAGQDITIDRIFIQSPNLPILFNGRAVSEKAIIDFKNALEKIPNSKKLICSYPALFHLPAVCLNSALRLSMFNHQKIEKNGRKFGRRISFIKPKIFQKNLNIIVL